MNNKLMTVLLFLFLSTSLFSANRDVVTLVAIGSAPTREDAVKNALRSAIEQTYGAFISSQTRILNDRLISDEIVAVSSGNVRKYTILAESNNGRNFLVSIKAEVSVSKLASFAESHGQSCSYNGDLLSNNIQLMRLRADNTTKCISNLTTQLSSLYKTAFEFKVEKIGGPIYSPTPQYNNEYYRQDKSGCYYFPVIISCFSNEASSEIRKLVENTLWSITVPLAEQKDLDNFVGLTYVPAIGAKLAGKQDYDSISNLLDACLYDISINADGIGTRINLYTLTKRSRPCIVSYSSGYSKGKTITREVINSSPFGKCEGWDDIERGLKKGMIYDQYVYVYEPIYSAGAGYPDRTTFGERFCSNNNFGIEIDKFDKWMINKKNKQTVFRVKLYIKISEDQLLNFKGFSIKR